MVGADATCTQSVLEGGDATALTVTADSLNTNAKVTFTLKASEIKAKVCVLIPASNGGEGVWTDSTFRVTVVGVSEMSPNLLAEDVETKSEITYVGLDPLNDELFVATTAQECIDETAVTGGALVKLDSASRTTFEIKNVLTNGILCIKVNGTSFTTGVQINVVKEGKHLTIHGPTYIPTGVNTVFNLTGTGVHEDYYIKWVFGENAKCDENNHTKHAVEGGEGKAVHKSTDDTAFATTNFIFTSPAAFAYACVLLPTGYVNQTTRIHIVKIDDVQPRTLGKNVSTEIVVTGISLTRSNMWIQIGNIGCKSTDVISTGGEERTLIGTGASHRLGLTLTNTATDLVICLRVGIYKYVDTGIRLAVVLPVINSYTLSEGIQIMKGEQTTLSLLGFGLTTLLKFKFIPSTATGCNDATTPDIASNPTQPFQISKVETVVFKARETGALTFKLDDSDPDAKICVKLPKQQGGDGTWTDTTKRLVVSWIDQVFPTRFHIGRPTVTTVYGDGLRKEDRIAIYDVDQTEWIAAGKSCPKTSSFYSTLSITPTKGI